MATDRTSAEERERRLAAHLQRAGELLRGDQVEAADLEVGNALRIAPDDVRARNLLGLVRFRAGRYEEAHQVYRGLVTRDPADPALRLNLGLVELRLGRNGDAAENLRKVVEKEPGNQKAQGYLGLALMRAGELKAARAALLAGGQAELARQVEDQMVSASGAAGLPVPSRARALEGELSIDVTAAALGGGAATAASSTKGPARDPGGAMSLAAFVERRELRPAGGGTASNVGPFSVENGLLVVRVDGRLSMRTAGALVSSGRLAYAPVMRRLRGKATTEPFGEAEEALVAATGTGLVVVSPRGGAFAALALSAKDVLYVRESLVFAFEDALYWENGRVPGAGGGGMIVQFRGEGRVVLHARALPYTVRVATGDVLYVEQDALMGWAGDVVPQQLRGVDGEPTQFVVCTGEGALLITDPLSSPSPATPPPPAPAAA